ncbi:MAG: hypothetical protein QOJ22_856 [Thermoleophilaceae bacterium]|jgi:hypothetical protein|nr:hypothetical protein [Thermoleophilaceae bacterium]
MLARPMKDVHAIVGIATVAMNAIAAAWGGWCWWNAIPSVSFWYLLRTAQFSVVVEVVLGVVLLAEGLKPPDSLHYLYAVSPLVIAFVTEGMRIYARSRELAESEQDPLTLPRREQVLMARRIVVREIGIMTIGLILTTTLLIRAAQSGGLF